MKAELYVNGSCKRDWTGFIAFIQQMVNRLSVGALRYTPKADAKQRYMSRMGLELETYRKTGNREHLLNIANYACLESIAPENALAHFDAYVESATRNRITWQPREGD